MTEPAIVLPAVVEAVGRNEDAATAATLSFGGDPVTIAVPLEVAEVLGRWIFRRVTVRVELLDSEAEEKARGAAEGAEAVGEAPGREGPVETADSASRETSGRGAD